MTTQPPADKNRIDMIGRRFGAWLVVGGPVARPEGYKTEGSYWQCQCDCGNAAVLYGYALRAGKLRPACRTCAPHPSNFTYGLCKEPIASIWRLMMSRCYDKDDNSYHRYGARGIAVCERWHDVYKFVADMSPRPSPKHSIDRINNNGNYEPGNCQWATRVEQAANKRNTKLGPMAARVIRRISGMSHEEIADVFGVSHKTIGGVIRGERWKEDRL